MNKLYDHAFFTGIDATRYRSARVVVPIVISLVEPTSVVDFGCGTGVWLRAFQENGVKEVLGVDGDWVDDRPDAFRVADLNQPIELGCTYDLAISVEVAEHLQSGEALVDSLVSAAPLIVFSAAIPGQGGVGHINEQWQDYWAERFKVRGFVAADVIRPRIWSDTEVSFWYRQNVILYIDKQHPKARLVTKEWSLNRIHPELLESVRCRPRPLDASTGKKSLQLIVAGVGGVFKAARRKGGL